MISAGAGSSSSDSSTGGFNALPKPIKTAYSNLGTAANGLIGANGTAAFTPLGQTSDETQGYQALRNNNPMANLQGNIDAQMNPYLNSVINQVQNQYQGQNSLTQQALNQSGTLGSNRSILGANDLDQQKANTIGGLLSNQFNTSLNNALTTIPNDNNQYAQGLLGIGNAQRGLDTQTNQAQINSLQALAKIIGVLPTSEGSSQSSSNSWNAQGSFGSSSSDRRLKENIIPLGTENGHNVYEFSYIGKPGKYIGVMADEVEHIPGATEVGEDGYKRVFYDKIGVEFREVQ